jgi:hypothetical protein
MHASFCLKAAGAVTAERRAYTASITYRTAAQICPRSPTCGQLSSPDPSAVMAASGPVRPLQALAIICFAPYHLDKMRNRRRRSEFRVSRAGTFSSSAGESTAKLLIILALVSFIAALAIYSLTNVINIGCQAGVSNCDSHTTQQGGGVFFALPLLVVGLLLLASAARAAWRKRKSR